METTEWCCGALRWLSVELALRLLAFTAAAWPSCSDWSPQQCWTVMQMAEGRRRAGGGGGGDGKAIMAQGLKRESAAGGWVFATASIFFTSASTRNFAVSQHIDCNSWIVCKDASQCILVLYFCFFRFLLSTQAAECLIYDLTSFTACWLLGTYFLLHFMDIHLMMYSCHWRSFFGLLHCRLFIWTGWILGSTIQDIIQSISTNKQ